MGSPQRTQSLLMLASSVGDFIRYWGFRRIHGELWAIIFLAEEPQSGIELAQTLKVSKSLVSPALRELEEFDLIRQVSPADAKTKRYEANPVVFKVIQQVLRQREMNLLQTLQGHYDAVVKQGPKKLNPERLAELGEMIEGANVFLSGLVKMDSVKALRMLAGLVSRRRR